MKYLSLEFYKMRHKGIFLTILALLAVELIWCTFPLKKQLADLFSNPTAPVWETLITTATLMKGLFFSVIIAVTVSRVNDMEHKGNTWKLLESSAETRETIWNVKFLSVFILIAFAQVIELGYLLIYGALLHIAEPFPFPAFLNSFLGSLAISASIILVQQWISMMVENQLITMAIGMFGGFIGLFSMFFPSGVRYLFIWSYYMSLAPTSFGNNGLAERVPISVLPGIIAVILAIVLYFLGRRQFAKTES